MLLSDTNVFGQNVFDGRGMPDCSMALRRRVILIVPRPSLPTIFCVFSAEFVWWHPRCTILGRGKMECRPECPLLVLPDLLSAVFARRCM